MCTLGLVISATSIFVTVEFMGVDVKSPQHTAVHPMYVSYSSLPTTLSNASTKIVSPIHSQSPQPPLTAANNHHHNRQNSFSNNSAHIDAILKKSASQLYKSTSAKSGSPADNNSLASAHKFHSYQHYSSNCGGLPTTNIARNLSFNLKQRNDIRYSEVLQQLRTDPNLGGTPRSTPPEKRNTKYKNVTANLDRSPSPPPVPPRNTSQRFGIENPFEKLNESLNAINENGPYIEPLASRARFHMSPTISPQHSFVARSPNLNRLAARRRLEGGGGGGNGSASGSRQNFCDQVRSPTRPLVPHVDNNGYAEPYSIHRVRSQDRITRTRRPPSSRRDQRPRSYCSANGNAPGSGGFIEQLC